MGIIDQPARRAKPTRELTEPPYSVPEERALIELPEHVNENYHTLPETPEEARALGYCVFDNAPTKRPWWKVW